MSAKTYRILALDHRGSLRKLLNPQNPSGVGEKELIQWKKTALNSLAPLASHLLVDPAYGFKALQNVGWGKQKLVLTIEKTGYTDKKGERITQLEYSVAELKEMGAEMIKLLIYYNSQARSSIKQLNTIKTVSQGCIEENLPFLLEIKPYSLSSGQNYDPQQMILQSAQEILKQKIPIGVYKTPYPGDEHLSEFNTIMNNIPWVVLSSGWTFQEYERILRKAMQSGASGFAAGRALWKDFVQYPKEKWPVFFSEVAASRMKTISQVIDQHE